MNSFGMWPCYAIILVNAVVSRQREKKENGFSSRMDMAKRFALELVLGF